MKELKNRAEIVAKLAEMLKSAFVNKKLSHLANKQMSQL